MNRAELAERLGSTRALRLRAKPRAFHLSSADDELKRIAADKRARKNARRRELATRT